MYKVKLLWEAQKIWKKLPPIFEITYVEDPFQILDAFSEYLNFTHIEA